MLPIKFSRHEGITLLSFIKKIKGGERDFFKMLGIPEKNFSNAAFEELLSNEGDVLSGVNKVQKNFSDKYFDLFDGCLIKHYDNGDVKFIFYTITRQADKILSLAKVLFDEFGAGLFDDKKHRSFTEVDKIIALANGIFFNEKDDHVHVWLYDDLIFLLQFRTNPLHQLSLMITIKPTMVLDRSVRRQGTIFEHLKFNIHEMLNTLDVSTTKEFEKDSIKFIDYTFKCAPMELSAFDRITIRIFDELKSFRSNVQTHVTLFSSKPIEMNTKVSIVEKLVKVYGKDDSGKSDIEFHEREILELNEFWTGRTWNLNQFHGIRNIENKHEAFAYSVSVADYEDERRFHLSILGYNNLVSFFTSEE